MSFAKKKDWEAMAKASYTSEKCPCGGEYEHDTMMVCNKCGRSNREQSLENEIGRLRITESTLEKITNSQEKQIAELEKENEKIGKEKARLEKELIGLRKSMRVDVSLSDIAIIRKNLSELTDTYDHVLLVTVLDIFDNFIKKEREK